MASLENLILDPWKIWAITAVVLLIVEMLTPGLFFFVCLALGAGAAALAAYFTSNPLVPWFNAIMLNVIKTRLNKIQYNIQQKALFKFLFCCIFIVGPIEAKIENNENGDFVNLLAKMTLEEKVGQLFIIGGNWSQPESFQRISKLHFGNAFLAKSDVYHLRPQQVAHFTNQLQKISLKHNRKIPMLIATDQEGGKVDRLKKGFVNFPSQENVGQVATLLQAKELAKLTGQQMRAVGVHVNFAPVLDINTNEVSHITREERSFSSEPTRIAKFAQAYINGYRESRVIACVKHFPGYGQVTEDPHHTLPSIPLTKTKLMNSTFYPFQWLIEHSDADHRTANAWDMIMTGHILIPALEPNKKLPGTLSKKLILQLLRDKWGYDGVIVTDDLNMGAMKSGMRVGEMAIKAFEAGVDLLLFVGRERSQKEAWTSLVRAFRQGKLKVKKLDETVIRILKLKSQYISFSNPFVETKNVTSQVNTPQQRKLRDKLKAQVKSKFQNPNVK